MPYHYRMVLTWSEAGQRWIAEAPDLPITITDGPTPEAAIANIQVLIQEWLMVAGEEQRPIPAARSYDEYAAEEDARDLPQTTASA